MIRRETWILIGVLAVLLLAAYVLNTPDLLAKLPKLPGSPTPAVSPTVSAGFVFPNDSSAILSFEIKDPDGKKSSLERGPGGVWVVKEPFQGIADQAKAEEAATQLATLRIIGVLADQPDPSAVGLLRPAYTLTVALKGQGIQIVRIGAKTVTGNGYYVQDATGRIVIVGTIDIDPLAVLLTQPPFAETPTASPVPPTDIPTETPLPLTDTPAAPAGSTTPAATELTATAAP